MRPGVDHDFRPLRRAQAFDRSPSPIEVSPARKIAAWSIRGVGFLLGVAFVSFYLFMAWDSPPDMSNARPRMVFNFYLTGPLLLLAGPMFLAGSIASRIDHRRLTD